MIENFLDILNHHDLNLKMMKTKRGYQTELAKRLNITAIYLNAVLHGRRTPSIDLAIKIEKESGGKIRATDLRPGIKDIVNNVLNCRLWFMAIVLSFLAELSNSEKPEKKRTMTPEEQLLLLKRAIFDKGLDSIFKDVLWSVPTVAPLSGNPSAP
jgi:transcriptional regulator with XRE-family HTH domain